MPGLADRLIGRTIGEQDWTDDFGHENGNYSNNCISCGQEFRGHKRRHRCRACAKLHLRPVQLAITDEVLLSLGFTQSSVNSCPMLWELMRGDVCLMSYGVKTGNWYAMSNQLDEAIVPKTEGDLRDWLKVLKWVPPADNQDATETRTRRRYAIACRDARTTGEPTVTGATLVATDTETCSEKARQILWRSALDRGFQGPFLLYPEDSEFGKTLLRILAWDQLPVIEFPDD